MAENPRVFFDIQIANESAGRIVIELYAEVQSQHPLLPLQGAQSSTLRPCMLMRPACMHRCIAGGATHMRELQGALHGREGRRSQRQAAELQGQHLSPHHPRVRAGGCMHASMQVDSQEQGSTQP